MNTASNTPETPFGNALDRVMGTKVNAHELLDRLQDLHIAITGTKFHNEPDQTGRPVSLHIGMAGSITHHTEQTAEILFDALRIVNILTEQFPPVDRSAEFQSQGFAPPSNLANNAQVGVPRGDGFPIGGAGS